MEIAGASAGCIVPADSSAANHLACICQTARTIPGRVCVSPHQKCQLNRQGEEAPKQTRIDTSTLATLDLVDERPSTRTFYEPHCGHTGAETFHALSWLARELSSSARRRDTCGREDGRRGQHKGAGQDEARRHQQNITHTLKRTPSYGCKVWLVSGFVSLWLCPARPASRGSMDVPGRSRLKRKVS